MRSGIAVCLRSRERVQRLLDTADTLIGLPSLHADRGAARHARRHPRWQHLPVLTRQVAVVDAVGARYMQRSLEILAQLVERIVELRWEAALDAVIEHFARTYRENPTFCEPELL